MKTIILGIGIGLITILGFVARGFFAYNPNRYILNVTANVSIVIPQSYYVTDIVVENTSANAVTGGIKIGTTSGGTDVVTAASASANTISEIGQSIQKRVFSMSGDQTLYVQAVSAWNSASINVYFIVSKLR